MSKLGDALAALERTLTDAETYAELPADELSRLLAQQGEQRKALERAEHDWLEASAALEASSTEADRA